MKRRCRSMKLKPSCASFCVRPGSARASGASRSDSVLHWAPRRRTSGSYCLFRSPVAGTRQGRTVLVRLLDAVDPDTGQRFTVKRYRSEKTADADGWRHVKIVLEPVNPEFQPIELTTEDEEAVAVVAELVEVIGSGPSEW